MRWLPVCRALTATILMVLTASVAAAETKELVVWHAYRGEEKAAFEKVVADFNAAKAGEGIKVTTLAVPYDAFADKITAAVPRGRGPDLFIFAQDRLGGWIEAGNLEPIDFYLEEEITARFIPSTFEAMTYRETVYGLPLNYKVIAMIYNTELVSEPPATTGELVTMTRKLTDSNAGKFGLAYTYGDFYYHAALMNGFGGGVFAEGRKVTMNSPENIKALELMVRWFDQDGILPAEPSTALITSLFNQGRAGIVFSGPWFLGEIAEGIDYKLAQLPTIDEAGGQPMRPWITVEGVFMTATSENKEAAYDFQTYITDFPAAKVLALEGRQTPSNLKVYEDEAVAADPILGVFRQQVEVSVPMPNIPEMTMVWSPATTAMNVITRKSATPEAAMNVAQKEVEERIAQLRK
jgi:arabinogalactan oligomer/maltooligosaccharide transport system substrate-binding protein